jgi:Protein of unknown function (DUF4242)
MRLDCGTRSRVNRTVPKAVGRTAMALFMDVHENLPEGATAADVAGAHEADLRVQADHGVKYLRYWVDEANGKVFCLVEAPDAEAANTVHREAHGLVADHIYEVVEGS